MIMQIQPRAGRARALAPGAADAATARSYAPAAGLARKGAYVLADARTAKPDVLLLAPAARSRCASPRYEQLAKDGIKARVVSMPSWELFDQQPPDYRDERAAARRSPHASSVEQASDARVVTATVTLPEEIIGVMHTSFGASATNSKALRRRSSGSDARARRPRGATSRSREHRNSTR